jgi:hypothetical protein
MPVSERLATIIEGAAFLFIVAGIAAMLWFLS